MGRIIRMLAVMLLLVCIIALSGFTASAAEEDTTEEPVTILELLQAKRGRIDELLDSLTFHESMDRVDISDPLIMVYLGHSNRFMDGRSLEEVLVCVYENSRNASLMLCSENPVSLGIKKDEQTISASPYFSHELVYQNEFQNSLVHQTFLGEECKILDIYLLYYSYFGTTIIYKTDKGDFVRFYERAKDAQPLELTWEDYSEYAHAYYEYEQEMIKQMLGGCAGSFTVFVEEYKAQKEAQRLAELEAQTRKWTLITVVGVVALGATTATILLLRRKRKNATAQ